MELLGTLESRVGSIIAEIRFLRKENAQLRANTAGGSTSLKAENTRLKRELASVQQQNAVALKNIEGILALTHDVIQDNEVRLR